uniref:Uncharacterized protein n=1 Tax=Panagrolaimus superbus TaxID=310955 RepID=A0A914YDE9_9BILA
MCEARASVAGSQELCNVDFMVKLNFLAQRWTENIAEMAANDLVAKIKFFQNPRARYFDDDATILFANDDDSSVEESDFDRCQAGDHVEVHDTPINDTPPNPSFLAYFLRKTSFDRPKSAMAALPASKATFTASDTGGRRSVVERKASPGGDILNLIRRSSMSSDKTNESPIKLPDDALAGLTDDEKEHILKVLAAANRSQVTPQQSRRYSCIQFS